MPNKNQHHLEYFDPPETQSNESELLQIVKALNRIADSLEHIDTKLSDTNQALWNIVQEQTMIAKYTMGGGA